MDRVIAGEYYKHIEYDILSSLVDKFWDKSQNFTNKDYTKDIIDKACELGYFKLNPTSSLSFDEFNDAYEEDHTFRSGFGLIIIRNVLGSAIKLGYLKSIIPKPCGTIKEQKEANEKLKGYCCLLLHWFEMGNETNIALLVKANNLDEAKALWKESKSDYHQVLSFITGTERPSSDLLLRKFDLLKVEFLN